MLKQSDAVVGVVKDTRRILGALRHSSLGPNGRLIRRYLETHEVRKLQIGAGPTALDGWLCTDIDPKSETTAYLDATKPFPFEEGTFDYIYSEHMIEHIPWREGLFMLRECRRVLKPGGVLRVATPDLKVLLDLYAGPHKPVEERYIHWITDTFLDGVKVYKPSFVINNAFHNWGHQFLYDAELLAMALREAGFTDIRQWPTGESDDPALRGIESHGRNIADDDMAAFETMVFEARPAESHAH
ncbi:class I SAM-dependent methyltransferase [Caenimonas soli]|uniref:class I SAM-dependent methyltransferase n=1 Tax=Caenimonas soli TaxID=2735555 RepID=UPI0015539ECB|nr:methyltransferase domain-containing protein [Caenimonas soli]NPC54145.1 methyltransferase domain-containing protein [Caenimonas soli]